MSKLSIVIFSALLCLALGWEPGTQYVYEYTGRAITGIYYLKQQNAIIEIRSRVTVQSTDENTLIVKLSDGHIKRNGKFEKNPFINGDDDEHVMNPVHREEIEGQEDPIANPEHFGAPFVITHNKGSFTGIQVGADEPLWVVNYKKSIASQLQVDINGVRPDSEPVQWSSIKDEDKSATFKVFEESISGDCSTTIAVHRMPVAKVYNHDAYKLNPKAFEQICKDEPVYEIIKTKDFNRCLTNPISVSAQPATYLCSPESEATCSDFMQRKASYRYVACGSLPNKLTYLSVVSWSDLIVKPFAVNTEELTASNALRWELKKKESISSRFSSPSNAKEYKSLSFILPEFEQDEDPSDSTFVQPKLEEAYLKSPIAIQKLQQTIYETLRYVAKDLKEKPDSESDNLERLAVIGRALPMFSLQELRGFWEQIKNEDPLVITLFVDVVVQSGSNPSVMLIKELVEKKEITELKSIWAVAALGYFAKTPTTELLHELVELYKSSAVQSSKSLKQTTLMTLADLFHAACGDIISTKRFPHQLGELCDTKDSVVASEFLPLLVKELEKSNTPAERIVALSAVGSFGTEEILPILLPYLRGSGDFNDTAERTRAVLSLNRVVYTSPEKVHPILTALAFNTEERHEVRMAAISILLTTNAPLSVWQKLATSTWYESSQQVTSFISTLVQSLTELEPSTGYHQEIVEKAQHAWTLMKRAELGLPYSFFDIRSTNVEGVSAIMNTQSYRVAGEQWPVFLENQYIYKFGPFVSQPLTIFLWNYNMGDLWQNLFGKLYGNMHATSTWSSGGRARDSSNNIKNVWDELKVSPRQSDKRVGLVHINLMGSINRFFDLEKLPEMIPSMMAEAMKYQTKPYDVSFTKYRMLAEYTFKVPTEIGLPMRFLSTLPIIASIQGQLKGDGQGGIKSDINAELNWKLSSELRVELPFNGNYIATGVDVRVDTRAPKELTFALVNKMAKITWTPGTKVTDLFYYHVKPYTITRNMVESFKPTLEDKAVHIISVNEETKRDIPLGSQFGVNVHLTAQSELDFNDFAAWIEWFKKWDINGISNLGFVPFDLKNREYTIQYRPEGTKARAVTTWFQYQYATKSCPHTVVFQTGEAQPSKSGSPEIVSQGPIVPEFKPAAERLFKDMDSGNVHLIRAGLTAEQKDGTFVHFNSTLGLSKDAWYTKDFTDLHIEKYITTGPSMNANKKVDFALCYWAVRNWNNPPKHGFSKDILYLTDDETIAFGEHCDQHKIRFKAKVYRDEQAAKHALYSPVGQQCQKDMAQGFMYGSPACEEARVLDQTYNNYEMSAEVEKDIPEPLNSWTSSFAKWLNYALYPYTVQHNTSVHNPPNRFMWNTKYNPYNGASNMTFVRPEETLVAHNVRMPEDYEPFSPLSYAYSQVFFPLIAGTNWIRQAVNITTGGVSENKCFVGPKSVYTFDGGFYNYTVDQCEHVLLTDCSQKSELVVTTRQEGQVKIVKVVYLNDTIELNPSGTVTINGAKSSFKSLDKDSRYEIRHLENHAIKAVVYPIQDGLVLEIVPLNFFVKVQASHVQLSGPRHLRGDACGMCGDYNQETYGEFKTPSRCTLSAGELMAASFKLSSGQSCNKKQDDNISRRLAEETETCDEMDVHYKTYLPEVEVNKPTKCTRYEKLNYEAAYSKGSCQSVQYSAKCQPGCKPHMLIAKPFTFKCSGSGLKDFTTVMTVPNSCITA